MTVSLNREAIWQGVKEKVCKYSKRIYGKMFTGEKKVDQMIGSFWIESMAHYYMMPLVAADMININQMADCIGKSFKYMFGFRRDIKATYYYKMLSKPKQDIASRIFSRGLEL